MEKLDLILSKAKMSLRITSSDFDSEISDLILAGLADLRLAGILVDDKLDDPLIIRAVITYTKLHFSDLDDFTYKRLAEAYELQRSQLYAATGYTDWGDDHAEE